jgi:hypothetical protein
VPWAAPAPVQVIPALNTGLVSDSMPRRLGPATHSWSGRLQSCAPRPPAPASWRARTLSWQPAWQRPRRRQRARGPGRRLRAGLRRPRGVSWSKMRRSGSRSCGVRSSGRAGSCGR